MIDAWAPETYSPEIQSVLTKNSDLIRNYYEEDKKLMSEHLNSDPYESLKPNRFNPAFTEFTENVLTPIVANSRIRVWHYTRLTDQESDLMRRQLITPTLFSLKNRLDSLVGNAILTRKEADTIYVQSPFHTQSSSRVGRLFTTIIPASPSDNGVTPLLESWGGESAYFHLSDQTIKDKLKIIGLPRVVEIETKLADGLNGSKVSDTILKAWANKLGISIQLSGCDLSITNCIETAKVIQILTKGERLFKALATAYPEGACTLLKEQA